MSIRYWAVIDDIRKHNQWHNRYGIMGFKYMFSRFMKNAANVYDF